MNECGKEKTACLELEAEMIIQSSTLGENRRRMQQTKNQILLHSKAGKELREQIRNEDLHFIDEIHAERLIKLLGSPTEQSS